MEMILLDSETARADRARGYTAQYERRLLWQ